jgi:hypothetical protein
MVFLIVGVSCSSGNMVVAYAVDHDNMDMGTDPITPVSGFDE